jgi:hypothetical protein
MAGRLRTIPVFRVEMIGFPWPSGAVAVNRLWRKNMPLIWEGPLDVQLPGYTMAVIVLQGIISLPMLAVMLTWT